MGYPRSRRRTHRTRLLSERAYFFIVADLLESAISHALAYLGRTKRPPNWLVTEAGGRTSSSMHTRKRVASPGSRGAAGIDFDQDGNVGVGDYVLWAADLGKVCPPGAAAVPESSTLGLLLLGELVLSWPFIGSRRPRRACRLAPCPAG